MNIAHAVRGWWRGLWTEGIWAIARAVAQGTWQVGRALTVTLFVLAFVSGLFPILQLAVASVVVGRIPQALAQGAGSGAWTTVWVALAITAASYCVSQIAPTVQWSLGRILGTRLEVRAQRNVMATALAPPGLANVEDKAVAGAADLVRQAREAIYGMDDAVRALSSLVSGRVAGLLATAVLAWFHWWAPVVLVLTFLPWDNYFRTEYRMVARSWLERTPEQARAIYFRDLGTEASSGKELRVFGLGKFVQDRFASHFLAGMAPLWRQRITDVRRFLPPVLLVFAGYLTVFGVFGWELATRRTSLTVTTVCVLMAGQVWRLVPAYTDLIRLANGAAPLPAEQLAAARLRNVAPAARTVAPRAVPLAVPTAPPLGEVRFDGVWFAYPGGDPVLRGLDLTIPAGRSTAIVGENGAGKTTLVKLLCGLYRPTSGRITVDGTNLADLDETDWRRHIAAVFQDYIRYPLAVRENVAWGAGGTLDDAAVWQALRDAGAPLESLARGLDTVLSRTLAGGTDLSGGQWQTVAVARALAGIQVGAEILILDEPTANLDVRAEAALFERILDIAGRLTSILISHRFANVRRADQIAVLGQGRVLEEGSHGDLMALGGTYAKMFRLQAGAFADGAAVAHGAPAANGGPVAGVAGAGQDEPR